MRGAGGAHRRGTPGEQMGRAADIGAKAGWALQLLEGLAHGAIGRCGKEADEAALVHRAETPAAAAHVMQQLARGQLAYSMRSARGGSDGRLYRQAGVEFPVLAVLVGPADATRRERDGRGWRNADDKHLRAADTAQTAMACFGASEIKAHPAQQRAARNERGGMCGALRGIVAKD